MSSTHKRAKHRVFPAAEKARILAQYDAATTPLERASIMRREAVYASLLAAWRKQSLGLSTPSSVINTRKRGRPMTPKNNEQLQRDLEHWRHRAEKAEELIETLGKVHAFLQNAVSKNAKTPQRWTELSIT